MTTQITTIKKDPTPYTFAPVRGRPERWKIVENIFNEVLTPLYGSQESALEKIEKADNRTCRLLYDGDSPKGLLVHKDKPDNTCTEKGGAPNSLELKTLLVIDPEQNSGRGIGSALLSKVIAKAEEIKAQAVHVTVSAEKPESLAFFKKHSFEVIAQHPGKYKEGVTEYVLQRLLPSTKSVIALPPPMPTPVAPPPPAPKRTYRDVTLKDPYVRLIANGEKTVEGRINAGMFTHVKPGDGFCFFNHKDQVHCHVTEINRYRSFGEMLEKEGVDKCLPGVCSLNEGKSIYDRIPGYKERAAQSGVLALRLEVDPNPNAAPISRKRKRE